MKSIAPSLFSEWSTLASWLRRPEDCVALGEGEFAAAVESLKNANLLPLFCRALKDRGLWESASRRANLEQDEIVGKAACALRWKVIDSTLDLLAKSGYRPILLKGTHLALRYYPSLHLRPMADCDVAFSDLAMAERAWESLRTVGFSTHGERKGGGAWDWSQHLPTLYHDETKFALEVHGALLHPPSDSRSRRLEGLMRQTEPLTYSGHDFDVLLPEANVLYLLAHFFRHAEVDAAPLLALFDVSRILAVDESRFDWALFKSHADATGLEPDTRGGLRLVSTLFETAIPEEWMTAPLSEKTSRGQLDAASRGTLAEFNRVWHARGAVAKIRKALHMIIPERAFMRYRFPDRDSWPIWTLYPLRWWTQLCKALVLARNLVLPRHTQEHAVGEKP